MSDLPFISSPEQHVLLLTLVLSAAIVLLARISLRRAIAEDSFAAKITYRLALLVAVLASGSALLWLFGIDVPAIADRAGNTPLTTIAGVNVTSVTVVVFFVLLGLSWYASVLTREGMSRALNARKLGDPGTVAAISRLVQYGVGGIGVAISLQAIGIDLGALVTAGAVFAVGIGFAMQNIAQNFVSGVILLAERSISPGDIVEVDGRMVRIRVLGIRSTIGSTLDDEEMIIPNSFLVQSNVKNFTLNDSSLRIRMPVGVAYESDLDLVLRTLMGAAEGMSTRMERTPVVALTAFGSSSVDFEVSVWISDPWRRQTAKSELGLSVWNALKAAHVTIAFPQLDVHFDAAVPVPSAPETTAQA